MSLRTVPDLPLCLSVLKHRVSLVRGPPSSYQKKFYDEFLLMWCINGPYDLVVEYRFIFIKLALLQIKHTHLLFL